MTFRAMLMASALSLPLAATLPTLADAAQEQGQGQQTQNQQSQNQQSQGGKSAGEKAAENQPTEVEDIRNINSAEMENKLAEQSSISGGDPSFAFPASEMIGKELTTGRNDEIGEIEDIIIGADNTIRSVVVELYESDRTVAVPFDQIRLRTGRGPEDVLFTSRMSGPELAGLPEYEFGDTSASMTAPDSAAADIPSDVEAESAGALNLTAENGQNQGQGQQQGQQQAKAQQSGQGDEMTTQRREQAEGSAMQVSPDDPSAGEKLDQFVSKMGSQMDQWYQRMAGEWQNANVKDDMREAVNQQWTAVREAWGDVRRAEPDNWEAARKALQTEMQEMQTKYQNAVSG